MPSTVGASNLSMYGASNARIQSPSLPTSDTHMVALRWPRGYASFNPKNQPNFWSCSPKKRGSYSRSAAARSRATAVWSPSARARSKPVAFARIGTCGSLQPKALAAAS